MCALAFPSGPAPRCDAKSVIWGVRCQLSLSGAVASSVFLRVLAGDLSSKAAPVRIRHGRGLLRRRHPHHGADHHEGRRQAGSRSFTRVSASSALGGVVPGCVPSPRGDVASSHRASSGLKWGTEGSTVTGGGQPLPSPTHDTPAFPTTHSRTYLCLAFRDQKNASNGNVPEQANFEALLVAKSSTHVGIKSSNDIFSGRLRFRVTEEGYE